jgi:L-rhamnose mutarotase
MVLQVDEKFSFEDKARIESGNAKVQEWEKLMWKFQRAVPEAKPGEKWALMERVFKL